MRRVRDSKYGVWFKFSRNSRVFKEDSAPYDMIHTVILTLPYMYVRGLPE